MSDIGKTLVDYFEAQGLGQSAAELVDGLLERALTFRVDDSPTEELPQAAAVFAFAFGNKADAHANLSGGPKNRELAELASRLSVEHRVHSIHAQWEIAEDFRQTAPNALPFVGSVYSYGQKFDRIEGKPIYQSTATFLNAVVGNLTPASDGQTKVIVVAHRDHYARCVRMTREAGYNPLSVQSLMPADYDQCSSQIWTTDQLLFVLHTIGSAVNHWKGQLARKVEAGQKAAMPQLFEVIQ